MRCTRNLLLPAGRRRRGRRSLQKAVPKLRLPHGCLVPGREPRGRTGGPLDDPEVGPDDVAVRPVASALNHMDLWLTKGQPRPRPAPRAGLRRGRRGHGGRCRTVTGVAVGDEVVINPAVSPVEAIVALGDDSPLGPGLPDPRGAALGRARHPGGRPGPQRASPGPPGGPGRSAPPTRWPPSPPGGCCAGPGSRPGSAA